MRILIVSNGFGEDVIGMHVAQAFMDAFNHNESFVLDAFPLVGEGKTYQTGQVSTLSTNPMMPSGGFVRSLATGVKDVKAGALSLVLRQRRALKQLSYDWVVAVGDVFCLWMAGYVRHKKLVFFPTAKSHLFMKHSWLELAIIKSKASEVFTRDQLTADDLKKKGLPASFLGNPMMDNLVPTGLVVEDGSQENPESKKAIICILPGSRTEAYGNLEKIGRILGKDRGLLGQDMIDRVVFVVAVSPQLDMERCKQVLFGQGFSDNNVVFTSSFVNAVSQSRLVIGLAGTANEQAVFLGKTVVCFQGTGPQSSTKRFQEQRKLLGPSLVFLADNQEHALAIKTSALILEHIERNEPLSSSSLHIQPQRAASRIVAQLMGSHGLT